MIKSEHVDAGDRGASAGHCLGEEKIIKSEYLDVGDRSASAGQHFAQVLQDLARERKRLSHSFLIHRAQLPVQYKPAALELF